MPAIGMMFTSTKSTVIVQKSQSNKPKVKRAQIGKNFMGLSTLKQSKGCKSCGH